MALRIRVLLENHKGAGADKSLKVRPGLSLLVEDESTSILFDTGPDGSFMQNALAMGIDLSDVSAVVLSHGHYDHCGGVPWLPDNSRIICHPDIARERYAAMTFLGITRKKKNCRVR
ncbi:Metallo-beta-lactamase [Salmonella enterica subsp. enterica serovar Heidelberg str. 41578]|nr:Metallo-beta-lactamase [Salmonella enterica subsp. enterica serovar Heidelberg str. 41578]